MTTEPIKIYNCCEMSANEKFKDNLDLDLGNFSQKSGRKNFKHGEIDKQRQQKLQKLSTMNIPQKSIAELSKLIINHQITDIGNVVKVKEDCVTIKAKVNLHNAAYRKLESEDVFIKVFTKKNHKYSDEEAADQFSLFVCSKDRNQELRLGYFFLEYIQDVDREDLVIQRVENVVIVKAFGLGENLLDMIKNTKETRLKLFTDLVSTIQYIRSRDFRFYASKSSYRNIFFNNNQWEIIDRPLPAKEENFKSRETNTVENLVAIIKLFYQHGVAFQDMKTSCFDIFKGSRKNTRDYQLLKSLESKIEW